MPWVDVTTAVAGTVYTAARRNTEVRDNFTEVRQGGLAISGQGANDFVTTSSATQLSRRSIVSVVLMNEVFGG